MKKQLSSIDLHYLVKELQVLKGSRIDKIYQPEKELIIFSLHKANAGKKLLSINIGKFISIAEKKEAYGEILGFGQFLRKHLDSYFLAEISQLKPERILKLIFKTGEQKKHLYIELIGKGNAILCDDKDIILNALEQHDFRQRSIRPKLKYSYPMMGYNLFDLKEADLRELLKNSGKDSLVICLATELGLGGTYSEEICLLAGVDKNQNPKNAGEKQANSILASIREVINHDIEAKGVFEDGDVIDFIPFDLKFYSGRKKQEFGSFNDAIAYFYSQFREAKETEQEKRIKSLNRIIGQQQKTIEELRKEEHEARQNAEAIYHNYQLIKEILDELNKASKKYSWKEIKARLKGHNMIKDINEKERKIAVEI
jgi:predicted ribosome quality control (RQC) complex YloA/Tae2 family protein